MPPADGLGIDRLVMLPTGSTSIRELFLFPLQRPEISASPDDTLRLLDTANGDLTRPGSENASQP